MVLLGGVAGTRGRSNMALATNATRRSIFMGVLGLVARGNAQGICPCNGWDFADLEIRQPPQKVASRFGPDAYVQIEAGVLLQPLPATTAQSLRCPNGLNARTHDTLMGTGSSLSHGL